MGHIFLGHGGLLKSDVVNANGFETVAVPPGTTLQFYSDFGQTLMLSTKMLDLWSKLQAPWPPLDSSNVTYNLSLSTLAKDMGDVYLHGFINSQEWANGHQVHLPGIDLPEKVMLCTGQPDCPTDPRPEHNRAHRCGGILAQFTGDLFWLACTSFGSLTPDTAAVLLAARGEAPADVHPGVNPDDPIENALTYLRDDNTTFKQQQIMKWFYTDLSQADRDVLLRDGRIAEWAVAHPDQDPTASAGNHLIAQARKYLRNAEVDEAWEWLSQTLTEDDRNTLQTDPECRAWIERHPLETGGEESLIEMARGFAASDPETFLIWYESKDDETKEIFNSDEELAAIIRRLRGDQT
ncbi:MAG TPA: hypothetical protein VNV62_13505 [Trebonia sp.]|nr:hypothetical protein [Trebonia sp.]